MNTKQKILIVGILALAAVVVGWMAMVQSRIDTKVFRERIESAVLEKTGLPITIRGQITISILPIPTIELPGIELRDIDNNTDTPVPALTADKIIIRSSLQSFLVGEPDVVAVILDRPILEIQRSQKNIIRWGWLNTGLFRKESQKAIRVDINGGHVIYRNAKNDKELQVRDINTSVSTGTQPQAAGSLNIEGRVLRFDAHTEAAANGGAPSMKFSLTSGTNDSLVLDGTADFSGDVPLINGKVTFNSEDVLKWFQLASRQDDSSVFTKFTGDTMTQSDQPTALPVAFTGQWAQKGIAVKVTVDEFKGLNSAGAGVIDAEWNKVDPYIQSTFNFSAINYDYWKLFLTSAYKSGIASSANTYTANKENPLPNDMTFSLTVNAKQVYFGTQVWGNTKFSATLDNAAITIHELNMELPGQSSLSLFGIVSQGGTREMRFEGNLETQGKSLRELFTVFDASALDLPAEELAEFRVRSNVYVSADQIRLSEADVRISDLRLNGGMVAYFDKIPRFEAEIKLNNINFDYFRDSWRKKYKQAEKETYFLQPDRTQNFNWLKKLKASVDFTVNVDKFRFMERDGDNASFRLFAQEGEIGLYNVRFNYPGNVLEAGFNLDVRGEKPFYNMVFNTDIVDTQYFYPTPVADKPKDAAATDKRWSEKLFDMSWMDGWKGAFDISVGKLTHGDWAFKDVKFKGVLDNSSMAIELLGLSYWQGKIQANGNMYGGKVPGLGMSFSVVSAELQEMLQSLIEHDNIAGKISINGKFATSGVNMQSWVSQAEAEMILNGQGVTVNGFNLQGVINAVAVSRTAADVLNNVNLALVDGKTEMSVEGGMNIKSGVLRTPGLTLKAENTVGSLAGEARLIPWKMDMTGIFQFPTISMEKPPAMTMQLTGPMNEPHMGVDTSSLEAYVAKRLTGGSGK